MCDKIYFVTMYCLKHSIVLQYTTKERGPRYNHLGRVYHIYNLHLGIYPFTSYYK